MSKVDEDPQPSTYLIASDRAGAAMDAVDSAVAELWPTMVASAPAASGGLHVHVVESSIDV